MAQTPPRALEPSDPPRSFTRIIGEVNPGGQFGECRVCAIHVSARSSGRGCDEAARSFIALPLCRLVITILWRQGISSSTGGRMTADGDGWSRIEVASSGQAPPGEPPAGHADRVARPARPVSRTWWILPYCAGAQPGYPPSAAIMAKQQAEIGAVPAAGP
jgi:hypothetical protein